MAAPQVLLSACAAALLAVGVANPKCIENGLYQNALIIFSCDGSGGDYESNLVKTSALASETKVLAEIPAGTTNFKALLRGQTDGDLQLLDPESGSVVAKDGLSDQGGGSYTGAYEGQTINFMASQGIPTLETVELVGATTKALRLQLANNGLKAPYEVGFSYDPWETDCPMQQPQGCADFDVAKARSDGLQLASWLRGSYSSGSEAWSTVFVPQTEEEAYVPYWNWPNAYQQYPAHATDNSDAWAMYKFVTHGGFEKGAENVKLRDIEWVYNLPNVATFQGIACEKMRSLYTDPDDAWTRLGADGRDASEVFWNLCSGLSETELHGTTVPTKADFYNYLNPDGSRSITEDALKPCYPNGPVSVTGPPPTPVPAPQPVVAAPSPTPAPEPSPSPEASPSPSPDFSPSPEPTPAPLPDDLLPPVESVTPATMPGLPGNGVTTTKKNDVNWKAIGIGTGVGVAVIGAATGIGIGVAQHNKHQQEQQQGTVVQQECSHDTYQCPDGGEVVRDPDANCNFFPCDAADEATVPGGVQSRVDTARGEGSSSDSDLGSLQGSSDSGSFQGSSGDNDSSGKSAQDGSLWILLGLLALVCCIAAALILFCLSRNKKRRSTVGVNRDMMYEMGTGQGYGEEGIPMMGPPMDFNAGYGQQMAYQQPMYTQAGYQMDAVPGFSSPGYGQPPGYGMQPGATYDEQSAFTVY